MALNPLSKIKAVMSSVENANCKELRRLSKELLKEAGEPDDEPDQINEEQVMRQLWNCPPDAESLQISLNQVLQMRFVSQYKDLKANQEMLRMAAENEKLIT